MRSILRQLNMPADIKCFQLILPPFPGTAERPHQCRPAAGGSFTVGAVMLTSSFGLVEEKLPVILGQLYRKHGILCTYSWLRDCTCSKAGLGLGCLVTL